MGARRSHRSQSIRRSQWASGPVVRADSVRRPKEYWHMEFLLGVSPRVGRGLAVSACCVLVLTACGRRNTDQAASNGQVVAHIGDGVITTMELDNEFRRANIPPARQRDPEMVRKVLSDLVL